MPKVYSTKNVFDAAMERFEYAFKHFDSIYFSVSGGKDSGVMVQLADMVAKRMGKKFDVLYIDFEAQYRATIDYIYELKELESIRTFYHVALPIALRNAVSVLQPKWLCWDKNAKDLWVRDMPKDAINEDNNPWPWFRRGEEFEEFIVEFAAWYKSQHDGTVGCGVGIRSDESLNRFRTIAWTDRKEEYDHKHWTTKVGEDIYNFYPLYDWRTEDIWGATSKLDLKFNYIYELMYKNGLSIYEQRLCQPFGDDQRNGLDQFKALEYDTWAKLINRVNGVNFGNIYCRTSALGNIKTMKPDFMTWEEYAVFLLESIGIYNKELMMHYYTKIKKFFKWYEKTENMQIKDVPDEADLKEEQRKKAASWRRIARAIERNDFYMTRLSFSMTKSDEKKLETFMGKWRNFLLPGASNDKVLNEFIERRKSNEEEENRVPGAQCENGAN